MDTGKKRFVGWARLLGRETENSVCLVRPVKIPVGNIPIPTAQVGDTLRPGEHSLAFLKCPLSPLLGQEVLFKNFKFLISVTSERVKSRYFPSKPIDG